MIALGAAVIAVGSAGLLVAEAATSYAVLAAPVILLGFGLGLVVPAMTATLLASASRTRSGIASDTLNTARQSGSIVGVALFGALISAGGGLIGGLHTALGISAVLAIAVCALAGRINERA